jgi:hypothetical protein
MIATLLVPAAALAPATAARAALSARAIAAPRVGSASRLAMTPQRGSVRMFGGLFDMQGGGSKDTLIKPEQVKRKRTKSKVINDHMGILCASNLIRKLNLVLMLSLQQALPGRSTPMPGIEGKRHYVLGKKMDEVEVFACTIIESIRLHEFDNCCT